MRVLYFTGTRADFGLISSTLTQIHADPDIELGLAVTGTHLDKDFGFTVQDIREAALPIISEVVVPLRPRNGKTVSIATSLQLSGFAEAIEHWKPSCAMVLGDRPEMLAAATAAALNDVLVCHLHGGERSGSVDESIRHAISKLAHVHCVATSAAAERLERMGEDRQRIYQIGAPGLDDITGLNLPHRSDTMHRLSLNPDEPLVLAVFHPVTFEKESLFEQMTAFLEGLDATGAQVVLLRPNSDAGGDEIDSAIAAFKSKHFKVLVHLSRPEYLSLMKAADVMAGNSSSGIIEAASFQLPVVDVGSRQNLRERGDNVRWVAPESSAITVAINSALRETRDRVTNPYGDGTSGKRLVALLKSLNTGPSVLAKVNAY